MSRRVMYQLAVLGPLMSHLLAHAGLWVRLFFFCSFHPLYVSSALGSEHTTVGSDLASIALPGAVVLDKPGAKRPAKLTCVRGNGSALE